jgi:hypothetical protein
MLSPISKVPVPLLVVTLLDSEKDRTGGDHHHHDLFATDLDGHGSLLG